MGQHYKDVAAIALKRREEAIPDEYKLSETIIENFGQNVISVTQSSEFFAPKELEIIDSSAIHILSKIHDRTWTALEVTEAFCKASAIAQQLTNCLTEILYPEARARARYLDDHLATTGQIVGPLHGLPISLKDCIIVPPHPASIGMAAYANELTSEPTILATILAKLGAVFYVKTTTPTAMMMMETINNVWGETVNPYHRGCSSGGSSGGEGALVAMRGSPIGIGTDIGGSIRIPSAFNNLYGLKPSFGRFPVYGGKSGITGQDFIYANNGPMARDLDSLRLYCQSVLSLDISPWDLDPKCLPIPWRKNVLNPPGRKLRLGIILDNDGEHTVHPPIARGLALTRAALEATGHEVFEWAPIDHPEIVAVTNNAFHTLGGAAILELTEAHQEPVFGSMKPYEDRYRKGEHDTLGPTRLREMIVQRNALQKRYLDRWAATAVDGKEAMDAIICASSVWTAPRLGVTQHSFSVNYTIVWNLLDYAACTFPVTFADQEIDKPRQNWSPLNELDARLQADYDPSFYHGTPVALQCVGRRLEDEKVLEMTGIISETVQKFNSTKKV